MPRAIHGFFARAIPRALSVPRDLDHAWLLTVPKFL